ncbi:hypothetical protein TKK_0002378 [Trichogramma kaykai]
MCEIIRELMQGANILTVVTDFEMPLKTALRETFGERVYLIGCFFHFLRCLNGKIHRLGLSDYVKNDAEANRFVRQCGALALVPVDLMVAIFDQMIDTTPARIAVQNFMILLSILEIFGLPKIKTIMKRQSVDFETIERGRTVARQASSASYFRESTLHAVWRQLYLNEISGLELSTICSNLIGEYYRSNLNNIRPIEIDEVIDLERRFDARRLGFNQVNDPDYNFQEVVGDYRRNEALILDPNIPENQRPRWLNVPAGDVRNNQARDNLHGSESAGLNGLDQPDRGTPSLASDPVAPVESQQQGQRPATSTNEPRTSRALETVARPTGIFATLGQLYSESDSEEGFSHTDAQDISARRGHDRAELAALPEVSDSLVPIGSQQQVQASAFSNNIPSAPLNNDDRVGASVAGPSSASVSREMCLLCCEEPKTHCFLSCFHYMCCEKCAEKVFKGRNNVCPNCRKKVTGVARIYE